MSTSFAIQVLLQRMPLGQIFTTRDLIGLGSRSAIDTCLSRLVDKGVILRVARGVFCNGNQPPQITPLELARIKARAFNKEVTEHATTTAQRLGYVSRPPSKTREPLTFATNGTGITSFQSMFGTIHLKAASARKRQGHKNEVWELLKALWLLGKGGTTAQIRNRIVQVWGRKSQESLQTFCASVPQWLVEDFPSASAKALEMVCEKLIPKSATRDGGGAEEACWCPDPDHCVCPMYSCQRCQDQPIRNRFSIAFG